MFDFYHAVWYYYRRKQEKGLRKEGLKMKKYELKFWRGNPQHINGGYETTRTVEVKNNKELEKRIREYEKPIYGSMECIEVKEVQ